jgi:hypothetical protein
MELRRHFGAAAEDAADAGLLERNPLGQRLQQLWRDEQTTDGVVGLQQRQRLIDDVPLVGFHLFHQPRFDQLDHPAGHVSLNLS